jgi:hypothetical protein
LEVHQGGTDPNLYAYVSGRALQNVDPLGLQRNDEGAGGAASTEGGAEGAGSDIPADAATANQSAASNSGDGTDPRTLALMTPGAQAALRAAGTGAANATGEVVVSAGGSSLLSAPLLVAGAAVATLVGIFMTVVDDDDPSGKFIDGSNVAESPAPAPAAGGAGQQPPIVPPVALPETEDPEPGPSAPRGPSANTAGAGAQKDLPIARQKQDGHIAGTKAYENRINQGKATSTFTNASEADSLVQTAWRNGTPQGSQGNLRVLEFGRPVGTGPRGGGYQTQVRASLDSAGRLHGTPYGLVFEGPLAP